MRIGILAEPEDKEGQKIAERLAEIGVESVTLNLRDFPKTTRVALHAEGGDLRLVRDGEDLSDVAAWYVRRFGFVDPMLKGEITKEQWDQIYGKFREWSAVEGERAVHVASLLRFLAERVPVVNPPEAFIDHNRKPHQVYLIRKAGLPVPDFLLTNDPEAIRGFMQRHGRIVYKPLSGMRHVMELTAEFLETRAYALANEPIMVQALAPGRHIRAYVVGNRLVGAGEILFDAEKSIDYRVTQRGVSVIDLPARVKRDCVAAARACGMPFTGLDVIWDEATDTHRFLECNPSPMFVNFERMSGVPVSRALAELLVERGKAGLETA